MGPLCRPFDSDFMDSRKDCCVWSQKWNTSRNPKSHCLPLHDYKLKARHGLIRFPGPRPNSFPTLRWRMLPETFNESIVNWQATMGFAGVWGCSLPELQNNGRTGLTGDLRHSHVVGGPLSHENGRLVVDPKCLAHARANLAEDVWGPQQLKAMIHRRTQDLTTKPGSVSS